jgi:hypothetical protein
MERIERILPFKKLEKAPVDPIVIVSSIQEKAKAEQREWTLLELRNALPRKVFYAAGREMIAEEIFSIYGHNRVGRAIATIARHFTPEQAIDIYGMELDHVDAKNQTLNAENAQKKIQFAEVINSFSTR